MSLRSGNSRKLYLAYRIGTASVAAVCIGLVASVFVPSGSSDVETSRIGTRRDEKAIATALFMRALDTKDGRLPSFDSDRLPSWWSDYSPSSLQSHINYRLRPDLVGARASELCKHGRIDSWIVAKPKELRRPR